MQFNGLNTTALPTDIADSEAVVCKNCDLSESLTFLTPPSDPFSSPVKFVGAAYTINGNDIERDGAQFYQDPPSSTISVAEAAAGANGSIAAGTYDFFYTLDNATGDESRGTSVVTHALTNTGKKLTLSWTTGDIPANWKIHIYGRANSAYNAKYALLKTIETTDAEYSAGTWDWEGDTDLDVENGIYTASDNYTPPTTAGFLWVHNSILFVAKGSSVYYSKVSKLAAFPANNEFEFNDTVTGMASARGELWISTETGITRIVGNNADDFQRIDTSVQKGCIRQKTFISIGEGSVAYVGSDGLYEFNGVGESKVSEKVNSLFETIAAGIAAKWDGRFYSISNGIRLDILRGNWMTWDSASEWIYQGKEFKFDLLPKGSDRIVISYKGDIAMAIYYDGTLIDTINLSNVGRVTDPEEYYLPYGWFERVQIKFTGTDTDDQVYQWAFWDRNNA